MDDCIFCKIVDGKIPAKFELNEDNLFAIQDINPAAPHHMLIIPKKHIKQISDLKKADLPIISELVDAAKRLAEKKKINGYRLVFNNGDSAGQSVYHIHLHLLAGRLMKWPPG